MKYRTDLRFNKDQTFGVEIEFADVLLADIKKESKKEHLPIEYIYRHYAKKLPYDVWYLDEDATVTKEKIGIPGIRRFVGGELSSKIMHDVPYDWKELKKICKMLRELHAQITSTCSNHVTVDISTTKNKREFYETLAQILAIYEPEIYAFYMGDYGEERETLDGYARLIRPRLLTGKKEREFFQGIIDEEHRRLPNIFTDLDAVHIRPSESQIEFRYPNGTLKEKTIQNNINFTVKLIQAISDGTFQRYRLNQQVNKLLEQSKKRYEGEYYHQQPRDNYFDQLVELIATDEEDAKGFYHQYQKVKRNNPKI